MTKIRKKGSRGRPNVSHQPLQTQQEAQKIFLQSHSFVQLNSPTLTRNQQRQNIQKKRKNIYSMKLSDMIGTRKGVEEMNFSKEFIEKMSEIFSINIDREDVGAR